MATTTTQQAGGKGVTAEAQPRLHQRGHVIQKPNSIRHLPIGLGEEVCLQNTAALNQLLADTITLYSLYKKSHWQVAGPTFYQLHLLFDKHAGEQLELVDLIAERVQLLGGVAVGMPHDVAEMTRLERPPAGVEEVPVIISRLLEAHEYMCTTARTMAQAANDNGDLGTNDLLVSDVLRTNELQAWFVAEHVADVPLIEAHDGKR